MRVILRRQAEEDFATQVAWLKTLSPRAGRRAATRIVETIDLLASFPDLGIEIAPAVREKQVQFGRDGFVIRYRRTSQEIVVLRIFHSRQDRV